MERDGTPNGLKIDKMQGIFQPGKIRGQPSKVYQGRGDVFLHAGHLLLLPGTEGSGEDFRFYLCLVINPLLQ